MRSQEEAGEAVVMVVLVVGAQFRPHCPPAHATTTAKALPAAGPPPGVTAPRYRGPPPPHNAVVAAVDTAAHGRGERKRGDEHRGGGAEHRRHKRPIGLLQRRRKRPKNQLQLCQAPLKTVPLLTATTRRRKASLTRGHLRTRIRSRSRSSPAEWTTSLLRQWPLAGRWLVHSRR